jgi:hypothetical protein
MKEGYYWAREKGSGNDGWRIVRINKFAGKYWEVAEMGSETPYELDEYEFGDKVEWFEEIL